MIMKIRIMKVLSLFTAAAMTAGLMFAVSASAETTETNTITITTEKDASVKTWGGEKLRNYGGNDHIKLCYIDDTYQAQINESPSWGYSTNNHTDWKLGYMSFDLSSAAEKTISSAKLKLTVKYIGNNGNSSAGTLSTLYVMGATNEAYKLNYDGTATGDPIQATGPWTEGTGTDETSVSVGTSLNDIVMSNGIAFIAKPMLIGFDTNKTKFSDIAIGTAPVSSNTAVDTVLEVDVTDYVRTYLEDTANGTYMTLAVAADGSMELYSKEYNNGSDAAKLEITYDDNVAEVDGTRYSNLTDAITEANGIDAVEVLKDAELDVSTHKGNVTMKSADNNKKTVTVKGSNTSAVFGKLTASNIDFVWSTDAGNVKPFAGAETTLTNVTVSGAKSNDCLFVSDWSDKSNAKWSNVTIENASANVYVVSAGGSSNEFDNLTIKNCSSTVGAKGIYVKAVFAADWSGTTTLTNSDIKGNRDYDVYVSSGATLNINGENTIGKLKNAGTLNIKGNNTIDSIEGTINLTDYTSGTYKIAGVTFENDRSTSRVIESGANYASNASFLPTDDEQGYRYSIDDDGYMIRTKLNPEAALKQADFSIDGALVADIT